MSIQETVKHMYDYSHGVIRTEKLNGMRCAIREGNGRSRSTASHSTSISGMSRVLEHRFCTDTLLLFGQPYL